MLIGIALAIKARESAQLYCENFVTEKEFLELFTPAISTPIPSKENS